MPYTSDNFVKAIISAHKTQMPNQKNRCSNNYNLSKMKNMKNGDKYGGLKFTFEGVDTISLMQDKDKTDPYIADGIRSGEIVDYDDCGQKNIYVANVVNSSKEEDMFCITVESVEI
ncbi:MAG: hypothetical protein LUG99_11675 [Lachnospiraceae bacterium]|nr:hypothetical protein [Lachnospiraceae bacterium]